MSLYDKVDCVLHGIGDAANNGKTSRASERRAITMLEKAEQKVKHSVIILTELGKDSTPDTYGWNSD